MRGVGGDEPLRRRSSDVLYPRAPPSDIVLLYRRYCRKTHPPRVSTHHGW